VAFLVSKIRSIIRGDKDSARREMLFAKVTVKPSLIFVADDVVFVTRPSATILCFHEAIQGVSLARAVVCCSGRPRNWFPRVVVFPPQPSLCYVGVTCAARLQREPLRRLARRLFTSQGMSRALQSCLRVATPEYRLTPTLCDWLKIALSETLTCSVESREQRARSDTH
jgi:hypothetical protein